MQSSGLGRHRKVSGQKNYFHLTGIHSLAKVNVLYRVPTGQGKLEKVREFAWSGKVRENQGKPYNLKTVLEKSGKMNQPANYFS